MVTGTIRWSKSASTYYIGLGILLLAAMTLANPRIAANWLADQLLAGAEARGSSFPTRSDSEPAPVVAAQPSPAPVEIASAMAGLPRQSPSIKDTRALTSLTATFQQGVGGYTGTQDTFVHQNFPTTIEGSVVSWKWDTEDPVGFQAFGLIRFDGIFGSNAGQIPAGSTITSATLSLVGFNATAAPAGTINEVAVDWQAASVMWDTFGGDAGVQSDEFRASPSFAAPLMTGATAGTPVGAVIDVTASLQSWSGNPALNFGWVFRPNSNDGAEVYSADQTTVGQRPLLTVTYDPPSGPCVNNSDCNDGNSCTTDTCNLGNGTCSHVTLSCPWGSCNPAFGACEVTLSFQNGVSGYSGTVDTYLDEANPALSHASDVSFFMDNDPTDKQGLIRFDGIFGGNGSSQIPPGATIRDATLTVNVNDPSDTGAAFHRMLACWDDTNTWSTFGAGIQADGIEAVATPDVPSSLNNNTPPVLQTIPVTNSLAAWSAGAVNLGWAALPLGGSGWGFDSAQGTIKPLLTVKFTPPAACTVDANCNDGNGCTSDTCNVATGFCAHAVNAGGSCSDGVSCTTDTCSACGRCASADSCTLPSVCNTGTGQCDAPPLPPSQPTNPSPADGATGVSTSPQLCVNVSDPNGDPLTVTFKGRQGGGGSGTPFTVIAMPDTQFYSESFPTTYEAQTAWIRDNRIARNIVMSVGLGDCVNIADIQQQWTNANAANLILENPLTTGLPDGIPYGIAVGNHDQAPNGAARSGADENITTLLYNQTFPKSRFQGRAYFGGQFGLPGFADSMDNHYELFSASGMDFIVFHLEWDDGNCSWPANGAPPTGTLTTCQNVMTWMRNLLVNTYPNRRAIIASHFVGTPSSGGPGTIALSNQGQAYLNLAKPLPNVFLMVGGHLDQSNHRVDLANDGHPIYTVVSDFQTRPNGGNGWLRIMTFDPAADTIHIETYSPTVAGGRFINKPTPHADDQPSEPNGNELTLAYDMDAGLPFQTIGTTTNVPSGTQTCVSWPGLTANVVHEWKVEVSDATATTTSAIRSFTTSSCSVNADCDDANVCTTDVCSGTVCSHNAVAGCCNVDADCGDGNPCNGAETCSGHTCHAGTAPSCDDGNPCTTDSCVNPTGCAHANNTNACNDGNACTTPDACAAGSCGGAYSPSAGCCTTNANCNDGNPATTDTCSGGTCTNIQVTNCTASAECDDGDVCTTDVCNGPNVAALSFDGANDYVTMGPAAGETALGARNFTLEAWIRYNGTTWGVVTNSGSGGVTGVPLITKGRAEADGSNVDANYFLGIVNGKLAADFEQFAAGGSPSFPAGQNRPACGTQVLPTDSLWHHVAVTYSTTLGWNFYVDGAQGTAPDGTSCSIAPTAAPCTTASQCPQNPGVEPRYDSIQHFGIGTAMTSTGVADGFFAGSIDEVRVWNVARTQAEIQASMNQQLTAGTGLIGRWGLNEAAGTNAADSTTPAENGTLTNGPVWSTSIKPAIGNGLCAHTAVPGCCNTAAQCDDGNPCTADSCSGNACQHAAIAGCCLTNADCNDANICTDDSCNVGSNTCQHASNAAPCSDGNICTTGDTCSGGSCQPGTALPNCCQSDAACNDANACTTDSCNTTNDAAVSFPTAAITNSVNFAAGAGSNASPDYINFFGNSSFTIEGWIYTPGGAAASTGVFRHGRQGDFAQVVVQLGGTGNLQLLGSVEANATGADQVDVTSPTVLTANTWNHFALVVDRSGSQELRLIVNGGTPAIASGALWSTSAISSTDQTMLGVARDATGALVLPFSGRLDEVRIWNFARTQAQIAADMNREIESATGLVHRWSFNAGTGTTAVDSVGTINGTLVGATTWSTTNLAFAGTDTCLHANVANGTTCSDGDACTTADVCTTGVCAGSAINCDDGNSCTTDSCSGGSCSHVTLGDGTSCSDGNACTTGDTCAAGTCVGVAINCDDGNACTTDSCTAGTCGHVNVTNGTTCSDGNACTTGDVCTAGTCAGTALNCDDGNSCTTDSCTAGTCGHVNLANGTTCSDNTACTTGDVCSAVST
jgi:hypothetical protein